MLLDLHSLAKSHYWPPFQKMVKSIYTTSKCKTQFKLSKTLSKKVGVWTQEKACQLEALIKAVLCFILEVTEPFSTAIMEDYFASKINKFRSLILRLYSVTPLMITNKFLLNSLVKNSLIFILRILSTVQMDNTQHSSMTKNSRS